MQVTLGMATDQLSVARESDVAFQHAGAHGGGGLVGLTRVFWVAQGRAAMADRKWVWGQGGIILWTADESRPVATLGEEPIRGLSWSSDGEYLLALTERGRVYWWNVHLARQRADLQ